MTKRTPEQRAKYKATWGTAIGKDCISLDASLCRWLGERLIFLAEHSHGYPMGYSEKRWARELREHGEALAAYPNHYEADVDVGLQMLADAQRALKWVTKHLGTLWD